MSVSRKRTAPMMRFLGAAGTVTGSRFLISVGGHSILVDCGLYQGLKELRLRNWEPFPAEPASIDSIVLSHAHLDHSGYIPALCRDGFRGRVFASEGTHALARIVLPDSGHLQEEEAEYANRKGYSRHTPALPLYTEEDAFRALEHFTPNPFGAQLHPVQGITATLRRAGHILGASSVLIEFEGSRRRRILFSGDLGRPSHPILRPPEPIGSADIVIVESTYGDRLHDDAASLAAFEDAIRRTAERGGVIVIPSFAVDRTEVVLHQLHALVAARRIPSLPVYVDSPMALASLRVYRDAIARKAPEIREDLPRDALELSCNEVRTVEESMALNFLPGPVIIISASGMATGGRVLHHLANRLPDSRNTVILVGYQADGTRGRRLLNRESPLKMLGRYVPVNAEIVNVPAFSVHADQAEIIRWLSTAHPAPEMVYVVHGETTAAAALSEKIRTELRFNVVAPRFLEQVRLD
jgi:metallo-beta-lactamase family protein